MNTKSQLKIETSTRILKSYSNIIQKKIEQNRTRFPKSNQKFEWQLRFWVYFLDEIWRGGWWFVSGVFHWWFYQNRSELGLYYCFVGALISSGSDRKEKGWWYFFRFLGCLVAGFGSLGGEFFWRYGKGKWRYVFSMTIEKKDKMAL